MDDSSRKLLIIVGALLVVALLFSALTGGMMGSHMVAPGTGPGGAGMGWMWGLGMGFGGLAMLLFWGALIIGVALAVRHVGGPPPPSGQGDTPLDIAKRRYAAGEITREQFEQIRRDVGSD